MFPSRIQVTTLPIDLACPALPISEHRYGKWPFRVPRWLSVESVHFHPFSISGTTFHPFNSDFFYVVTTFQTWMTGSTTPVIPTTELIRLPVPSWPCNVACRGWPGWSQVGGTGSSHNGYCSSCSLASWCMSHHFFIILKHYSTTYKSWLIGHNHNKRSWVP